MNLPPPTPNWRVFRLLWKAARRRVVGRQARQRAIMRQKKGSSANPLGGLAFLLMILVMALVHGALGWMLVSIEETARTVEVERNGQLIVPNYFQRDLEHLREIEDSAGNEEPQGGPTVSPEVLRDQFAEEVGHSRKWDAGGTDESQRALVAKHLQKYGTRGFVLERDVRKGPGGPPAVWWPAAGFIFLWWLVMIVFQGEGLELDIQRRRHPMWEWLQSHPVRPVTAFAADLLAPMMANPVYFTAPIFWWLVLGSRFGVAAGFVGGLVVGLAFSVAASAMNKALEISAMLRFSPRNRGALLGFMSWLGYAAMMLPLFSMNSPGLRLFLVRSLAPLADWLPLWPVRALTVGWGNAPAAWQASASGVLLAAALLAGAVTIAWWAANAGLQASGGVAPTVRRNGNGPRLLAGNPLYRKELLWFWRDKGAVVQAVLIPLTIAGFQVFNLRGLLNTAMASWNGLCGVAILCGTYFLLVLGPRSLASEGAALWLATTWPRGMEDLLKAKARLWWMFSNAIVGTVLLFTVWWFPQDGWRIAMVAVGWFVFGRSLAEKTVTLAAAPSSSGEPEPAPKGRQWAAMLGTLAFASGVITGVWSLAVTGVVFSSLTAAAMWQNFRARLPFLFDPWSEKLPPAPSLMHAMVGIAAMIEVIALTTAIAVGFAGKEQLWFGRAIAYGLVGFIAWGAMELFLARRGVRSAQIWYWGTDKGSGNWWRENELHRGTDKGSGGTPHTWSHKGTHRGTDKESGRVTGLVAYLVAVGVGAMLGGCGLLYLAVLRHFPLTRELADAGKIASGGDPQRWWLALLAVGLAPFAEEYFFRGLLFRALDREWGDWRAVVGSAAYFAIFHPPLSWLPVFALGICSAWWFRTGGRLGACVAMHMVYNAMVVWLG